MKKPVLLIPERREIALGKKGNVEVSFDVGTENSECHFRMDFENFEMLCKIPFEKRNSLVKDVYEFLKNTDLVPRTLTIGKEGVVLLRDDESLLFFIIMGTGCTIRLSSADKNNLLEALSQIICEGC